MAGNVNNISRSFADNVNYLAELDNQYYRTGFIKRNGINIDGSVHRGIVKLNVFDLTSKEHKNTEIYSADINGNADLINFFNNMKNIIIGLYPDVSINVSVVDGTNIIPDKNIDIQISSTNTILGQIIISIHTYVGLNVADYAKYTLISGSDNYIAVLPYLSQLDDSFNNAILSIGENSNSIKIVSDSIDNVNVVKNSIDSVNTNALNINSINTNASNIVNINNLSSRANDIESIVLNVIPNLDEILLADDNAIIATTKASEANESASSALSSKNNAASSESNAFSYMNSAFQYKDNALASANNALSSEQNAASSESNARNSELNASVSESNALTYRNETEVMKLAVETIYDTFDDRFLGAFNSDPILDNDGNALISGALYFNPTSHEMKVYDAGTVTWYSIPQIYLSTLLDVELVSISTNNVLIWNGAKWVNSNLKTINGLSLIGDGDLSMSAGGGYAANVYLTTTQSTTNGSYSQLSYAPEATETILSATANNNTVLIEDYIFDGDVQAQFIPAGEWGFHFHRKVDNTAADTKIVFEIYKRSNTGVETVLFSVSSLSIEDTNFSREDLLITKPSLTVNTTDRIGLKVYATTTRTSNVTVQLKVGDGEACYFNTPLAIRHNQLRARDEVDSHTIGSITGLQTALDNKVVKNNDIVAGTGTKIAYDSKGLILSSSSLIASDIPSLDTSKLTTGILSVTRGGTGTNTATGSGNVVLSNSPTLVTPNIGVATGTSFNSITGLSTVAPLVAGTAAVGTSTLAARQDHVHPVQTSVSGNAGTATTLQIARLINGTSFNGSVNITVPVNTSQKSDAVAYNIPFVSSVTAGNQNLYTDSVASLTYNPSTDTLSTTNFAGNLIGNASMATSAATLQTARTISLSGDVTGSVSFNGSSNVDIVSTVADNSHNHTIANVTGLQTALDNKVDDSEKGSANGVATLDVNGKVVLTQIPDSVLGQLEYQGVWDFTTLPTATQKGQYWVASVSGNGYVVGDWAVWNGTAFDKVDNTDAVASVAGRTGNVVLTKSDVGLNLVDNTADSAKNVLSATKLTTTRNIALTGDVTGNINFDGSANVSIATTIAANSVALGTDTTGNYVAGATAGTGISISGTAGEGWSPTITNTAPNVTTDISITHDVSSVVVNSSDGLDGTINAATSILAGIMTSADKTKLDGIATGANNYTLPTATSAAIGGVKVSSTAQTVAANAVSATAAKTYAVQLDASGNAVVNVPWVDTNTVTTVENVLNSTSTTNALSAAQGKALQDSKAPLISPTFTGTPVAPTASVGTSTTQIATTGYVVAEINKIEEW